mgnify:CR=1 FL=1|tara:strand:- start:529 stop:1248 length:720 start_codon:yes stop_codon:yes gene_type:complete
MNKLSNLLLSDIPKYEVILPSSGDRKSFRPFLVKEEKILLLAQQSGEDSSMIRAIKNIIESCVDGVEDAGSLPLFDVEYIFLQIRAKSVGEGIEPTIVCPVTEENIQVKILIPDIEIIKDKNHTNEIKISKEIILKMRYPSLNDLDNRDGVINYEDPSSFYDLISDCIVSIQTTSGIVDASTLPREEILEFVDNMTKTQFEKLLDFFLTAPKIEHKVLYTASDDVEREVLLSGLSDFFG